MIQEEDVFRNLEVEHKDRAMNSQVYILNTANGKYVAKINLNSFLLLIFCFVLSFVSGIRFLFLNYK